MELYKELIDNKLKQICYTEFGQLSILPSVLYSVSNGKRIRSIIVAEIIRKSGGDLHKYLNICLVPELVHNASLIIDDLPSMDNDLERRGKPTTHVIYGEAVAILTALGLISSAGKIVNNYLNGIENLEELKRGIQFNKKYIEVIGSSGLTGGQSMDITINDAFKKFIESSKKKNIGTFMRKTINQDKILDLINKKTSSLFEASFLAGLICSQKEFEEKDAEYLGRCFGTAFQLYDDINDYESDKNSKNACVNYAVVMGLEKAEELLMESLTLFKNKMKELNLWSDIFLEIVCLLSGKGKTFIQTL